MIARSIVYGMAAGAAGTAVLNATTYADMAVRARPPSELPQNVVKEVARRVGVAPPQGPRETAYGALLGYADGFAAGALLGMLRPALRKVPWFVAGLGLGALTMLLSEGTATAMGQTDPRKWEAADWIADIVPRCLYGWSAVLTYDRLAQAG